RQRSEEHLEGFRQRGGGVVCQKRAQGGEQECHFRAPLVEKAQRNARTKKASAKIHKQLQNQDCAVMFHSKDRKNKRQESGISRQANVGRYDSPGAGESINSVLQPILRDVAIYEGVVHHTREVDEENDAKEQARRQGNREKPNVSAHQVEHCRNYTLF